MGSYSEPDKPSSQPTNPISVKPFFILSAICAEIWFLGLQIPSLQLRVKTLNITLFVAFKTTCFDPKGSLSG